MRKAATSASDKCALWGFCLGHVLVHSEMFAAVCPRPRF
jgi:hypothetical protein